MYVQVIWEELYLTKLSRDKCTLYQLWNLIDWRDISSDPKGKLHACQSFLKVVIEAEILAAFVATHHLKSLDANLAEIVKEGVPATAQGKLACISQLALKAVKCTSLHLSGGLEAPGFLAWVFLQGLWGCSLRGRWTGNCTTVEISFAVFQTSRKDKVCYWSCSSAFLCTYTAWASSLWTNVE